MLRTLLKKEFLVILICIFLTGCAIISDYYISQPTSVGINYKFWSDNGIVALDLENIMLYLQPQNSVGVADGGMLLLPIPIMGPRKEIAKNYTKGAYLFKEDAFSVLDVAEGDYFYIEILLKAREDGLFFNPREVYLEPENSNRIQASKYLIPEGDFARPHNFWSPLITTDRDFWWRKESNEQTLSKYCAISSKKYVGFAIRFETPTPNPGTPFNIEIKGLKFFENTILIPKIKYRDKKRVREWRTN